MRTALPCLALALGLGVATPPPSALGQGNPSGPRPAEVINPSAPTCFELMGGCGVVSVGPYSLQLKNPDVSRELDGSLSIEAVASWQNQGSILITTLPVKIKLPPMLLPFPTRVKAAPGPNDQ